MSAYTPHSGPSIGGTKIKMNGFGFSPIKDQDGNPDKDNKMWARFIDPDTGE